MAKFKIGDRIKNIDWPGLEGIITGEDTGSRFYIRPTKEPKSGRDYDIRFSFPDYQFELLEKKKNPTFKECFKLLELV